MKLNLKKRASLPDVVDLNPKVSMLRQAVLSYTKSKVALTEWEKDKEALKTDIFPFGERNGDASWKFTFGSDEPPEFKNVSIMYTEIKNPYLDEEAATKILKEKRLYAKCLTTPVPAPPPKPFLDAEKIQQLQSEGKLTAAEVKKMIKMEKKSTKRIAITLPEAKRGKAKN